MKPASAKEIKDELRHLDRPQLLEIVLRLSRFKKENKELLTYLLFDAADEEEYKLKVKAEIDEEFAGMNCNNFYYTKKSMRKLLKNVKKYSRYSGKKETELELLIYFLLKMNEFRPSIHRNKILKNMYDRQLELVNRNLEKLHEDLQYDLKLELEKLSSN